MRKLYFFLFLIGSLSLQAQDVDFTFRVNMNETGDFESTTHKVWVVMSGDADWNFTEYYEMTDGDTDGIYEYTLTVASGGAQVVQPYSFAYGPDADSYTNWETPPAECANAENYREITVPADQGDTILPAFYYGTCSDVLGGIMVTFQVDMNAVTDLYEGGAVWVNLDNWTSWYEMEDGDEDGIYTVTLPYSESDEIRYIFSYQNGADPESNYADESVPAECVTDGQRVHTVGAEDETLPLTAFGACPASNDVSITFRVNMNATENLLETDKVWVVLDADQDWNWTEYYEMSDGDADGIFEYTLVVSSDGGDVVQQYSFAYGAAWDNYTDWETPPAECANENDYREVTVPAGTSSLVLPAYYYRLCTDDLGGRTDVTFQLDLSDISDLQGAVWVNIGGDWSDWFEMSDAGGGLWTATKSYEPGEVVFYTYAYQNGPDPDNDYVDESVPEDCGGTFGVRRVEVGSEDITLPMVKFSACPASLPDLVEITFSVDMSAETVSDKQVWQVIKSPWYWNELSSSGDDIYTGKVKVYKEQQFPYTFLLGAMDEWDGEESVPAECNFGTETAPERLFEGSDMDSIMPVIVFGACVDLSEKYDITFRVDMSQVEDLYEDGAVWVNLNSWTDWYDMADGDGDLVYEYTAQYSEGEEISYIFSYQNGADPNNDYVDETVPEACAAGGQRTYTVGASDAILDLVSFGSCDLETSIGQAEGSGMKLYPNPASGFFTIDLDEMSTGSLEIMDLSGRVQLSRSFSHSRSLLISTVDLHPGLYLLRLITGKEGLRTRLIVR